MTHEPKCRFCVWASTCLLAPPNGVAEYMPRQIDFKRNGNIYSSGLPAEAVFAVCSGSVSLALTDPLGRDRIVRFVRAGELFGLDALLPSTIRLFSATAREQCRLCFVNRTTFLRLIQSDGTRALRLLLTLNSLVHQDDLDKMELLGQPARNRLRGALMRFVCATDAAPAKAAALTPLKQWEIAQFLGMSVETVSRKMKELRARSARPKPGRV